MSEFTNEYQQFFLKSNAGKSFMEWLDKQVDQEISRARRYPEHARDSLQVVNGLENVKEHIDLMCLERNAPKAE